MRRFIQKAGIIATIIVTCLLMFQDVPLNLAQKFFIAVTTFEYTMLASKKSIDSDDEE
jgi:hypothetical protein